MTERFIKSVAEIRLRSGDVMRPIRSDGLIGEAQRVRIADHGSTGYATWLTRGLKRGKSGGYGYDMFQRHGDDGKVHKGLTTPDIAFIEVVRKAS